MNTKYFVLLNKEDNVLVCCQELLSGNSTTIEGANVTMSTDITVGHKLARNRILKGEKILKYGVSIGSATQDIEFGEHVHLHNMKSDYIASHTRQAKVGDEE